MNVVRLSSFINSRNNNFNLIRFFAAILVIISHCYPLTGRPAHVTQFGYDCGNIAVDIFFVTSGFLVTGSLIKRNDLRVFVRSRALRIFPGLLVNLLFCVVIVGPLFTIFPLSEYFFNRQALSFLIKNLLMFVGQEGGLPGVFLTNPYPLYVNGSLWTLPYEVQMYGLVAGLGLLTIGFKRHLDTLVFSRVVIGFASLLVMIVLLKFFKRHDPIHIHPFFRLGASFSSGMSFYVLREKIALSTPLLILCLVILVLFAATTNLLFVPYLLLGSYIIFYLAYIPSGFIRRFNVLPDYSYGLYIYGFTVQQAVVMLIPTIGLVPMLLLSIGVTLPLAGLSWHFVEKPALRFKNPFFRLKSI